MSAGLKALRWPRRCWVRPVFDPQPLPRLFGLPPGARFPDCLVRGLVARLADSPPEAIARVTVYLNTARMRERVRAAFRRLGPSFLPDLRLISDLGDDPSLGLPPPLPSLRRRLELAQLVGRLAAQERDFAPGTAVIDLADTLADLIDEMAAEGVAPAALDDPALGGDHAAHWERSLQFLRLIGPYLTEGAAGSATLQRQAAEQLVRRWQTAPPPGPVLVAGSTGSRGSTLLLMQAVARLPQGAVVLPGFDPFMTGAAWASLTAGPVPDEDHPQYRFARLLTALGLGPADVADWGGAAPDPARNRLLSLALRPAPVTDQWLTEGASLGPLNEATRNLSLIEAPTPRAEALAISLALRRAVADGCKAVLLTPDRTLARRVTAALDRWGIVPDDSGGRPLHLTAPGRLIGHLVEVFGRRLTGEALLVLLKHPMTATGSPHRGDHLRLTRDLELHLRRHGPAFPDGAFLAEWAGRSDDLHRSAWADWLARWLSHLPPAAEMPLLAWTDTLFAMIGDLAAGPGGDVAASEVWRRDAGEAALAVLQSLRAEAGHGGDFHAADFADLVRVLLQKEPVRASLGTHPLIAIEGTREARELEADLVIVGGLNDGVWPAAVAPDPWLSRQMRLQAGLLLPERQIGLSAHDFQIAAAGPCVILSRALRDDEAETVPSRWLDRLTNLIAGLDGEAGALAAMRGRGRQWLDWAVALDRPGRTEPAARPAPRPPVAARPRELPVTAITRLIRDPYAVYARYILRLRPLDPLRAEPDARIRGKVLHRIVELFVRGWPGDEAPAEAKARLLAVTDTVLAAEVQWPTARALWRARIARIADRFVAAEERRRATAEPMVIEAPGAQVVGRLAFTLTARPDRIDLADDGTVHVYDYKSGAPPSKNEQFRFEKQLPLEAAMAERGAFAGIGARPASGFTFVQLGGEGDEKRTERADLDLDAEWAALERLIGQYLRQGKGFTARRAVFKVGDAGDYDHLARFGEWQMADAPRPEDVGDE